MDIERRAKLEYTEKQKGDVRDTWADAGKAEAKLNWNPSVIINKRLNKFEDWFIKKSEG